MLDTGKHIDLSNIPNTGDEMLVGREKNWCIFYY